MAALGTNPDLVAREHPVFDPPYALQHAYAADPGTFTKWIVEDTGAATLDEKLAVLVATNARFDEIAAKVAAEQAVQAVALLKELAEDVLAAEPLEMFLTVTVPEGGKVMVVTVTRLARYRPDLSVVSNWSGKVFGFLGEVEDGQLPPLVRLPDTVSLRQAMEPHDVLVPTWELWNAHYGVGPDRVPILGEDLLMSVEDGTGRTVSLARLQYIPRAWAPYFAKAMPPESAMRMMRHLINALESDHQRNHARVLERWCAAACTRAGPVGTNRARSTLHIQWASPGAALDRSLARWAARKAAPYVTIAPAVLAAAAPPPVGVAGVAWAGIPPAPGYLEPSKDKEFSPGEQERIRLACGLVPANYELGRPPIYAAMLAEGRTIPKVEAVLHKFLSPPIGDWDPIRIYVSTELVRDMKDLKFGWGNENTYDTCHRGISPFAVLQVSMEQQQKRRRINERAMRATHLSTEDIRSLEGDPGSCPETYHSMLNLIRRYIRLLTVFFGNGCSHLLEVQAVFQVLSDKVMVYETMSAELVAETLWQIFIDARECFSHHGPVLPDSTLFALRDSIRNCTLKATINCPVRELLGRPPLPRQVSEQGGSRSGESGGSRSGDRSRGSMSTLTTPSGIAAVNGRRTNPAPVPEIVNIMTKFREEKPGIDMMTLMRAQKLVMADVGLGGRGQCLDFMYFGECDRAGCSYNHAPAKVSPGKRNDIVRKMTKAVADYIAAAATTG